MQHRQGVDKAGMIARSGEGQPGLGQATPIGRQRGARTSRPSPVEDRPFPPRPGGSGGCPPAASGIPDGDRASSNSRSRPRCRRTGTMCGLGTGISLRKSTPHTGSGPDPGVLHPNPNRTATLPRSRPPLRHPHRPSPRAGGGVGELLRGRCGTPRSASRPSSAREGREESKPARWGFAGTGIRRGTGWLPPVSRVDCQAQSLHFARQARASERTLRVADERCG